MERLRTKEDINSARVMAEQFRNELKASILSSPKVIGARQVTFLLLDCLQVIISRIGRGDLDYPEEDE